MWDIDKLKTYDEMRGKDTKHIIIHEECGPFPTEEIEKMMRKMVGIPKDRFIWGIDPYKEETPKLLLICG